jgi:hypothetical protein
MAWCFGESFDLYSNWTDAFLGYWEPVGGGAVCDLVAGRFAGSSAARTNTSGLWATKTSGANDSIHHINCAFQQSTAPAGTNLCMYLQLLDGTTNQCCIVFRSDGAILLTSGGPTGTALATYTGAFPSAATWYGFEFEVVIHNTAGVFRVRKNGNTINDFDSGAINTRGGTANNYANKLQFGQNTSVGGGGLHLMDDLLWRSDATSVSWAGDVRCFTRLPASDASAMWVRPTTFQVRPFINAAGANLNASQPVYSGFISPGGTVASVNFGVTTGITGNVKCAIFACVGTTLGASGSVGAVLATATAPIANPVTGTNTFTFSPPVSLPVGTLFYVAVCSDTTISTTQSTQSTSSALVPHPYATMAGRSSTTYASFPAASPTLTSTAFPNMNVAPVFTPAGNFSVVADLRQDTATGYVSSATVADSDLYGVAGISTTPSVTVAVTTRAFMQKTDSGPRAAVVQLKSGATTVQSPGFGMPTGTWTWAYRTDVTDPATGSAWTPTAVNSAQVGPIVTS